jgi:hypothetical protein
VVGFSGSRLVCAPVRVASTLHSTTRIPEETSELAAGVDPTLNPTTERLEKPLESADGIGSSAEFDHRKTEGNAGVGRWNGLYAESDH